MADKGDHQGEDREFFDLLATSALNDYPNPQREGCPGRDFLHTLAFDRKSIPLDDPRLDHVVHCSPCFRELTEIRAALRRRRTALFASVAAAAAFVIVALALWLSGALGSRGRSPRSPVENGHGSNSAPILAEIDLRNRSITRGVPITGEMNQMIRIPKGHLRLTIVLPFGSEKGPYDVEILEELEKPLVAGSGQAAILDDVVKLTVSLNTSSLHVGDYLMGIRRPPHDWAFDPVTVE